MRCSVYHLTCNLKARVGANARADVSDNTLAVLELDDEATRLWDT